MTKKQSTVLEYMTLVYRNATAGVPHSYERINHTMQRALMLAVGAFKFEVDDWRTIRERFGSSYWLPSSEGYYATAVINGNSSAVASIEAYLGRTPLIADDVRMAEYRLDANIHGAGDRQRERLHVGARFTWKGQRVKITSMGTDSAVACSYRKVGERVVCETCKHQIHWPKEKIHKRYTITREAIIEERAERKRRDEIWERLCELSAAEDVQAALGSTKREDFDQFSLKQLEKMLAKIEKARGTGGTQAPELP